MKNKDRYDLNKLKITVNYHIDGCGKKIMSYRFIDIQCEGEYLIKEQKTKLQPIEFLFDWLERET